jgi:hypothetical protein
MKEYILIVQFTYLSVSQLMCSITSTSLSEVTPSLADAPGFALKEGCKPCYINVNLTKFRWIFLANQGHTIKNYDIHAADGSSCVLSFSTFIYF